MCCTYNIRSRRTRFWEIINLGDCMTKVCVDIKGKNDGKLKKKFFFCFHRQVSSIPQELNIEKRKKPLK